MRMGGERNGDVRRKGCIDGSYVSGRDILVKGALYSTGHTAIGTGLINRVAKVDEEYCMDFV